MDTEHRIIEYAFERNWTPCPEEGCRGYFPGKAPPPPPPTEDEIPEEKDVVKKPGQVGADELEQESELRSVYMIDDGKELEDVIKFNNVFSKKTIPEVGIIYVGKQKLKSKGKTKMISPHGILHIEHLAKHYLATFGPCTTLLKNKGFNKRFGVKIALGVLATVDHAPSRSSVYFEDHVNSFMAGGKIGNIWKYTRRTLETNTKIIKSINGETTTEYLDIFGDEVKASANIHILKKTDYAGILPYIQALVRIYNFMDDIMVSDEMLIQETKGIDQPGIRRYKKHKIPILSEFHPRVLRIISGHDEPVGPSELYHEVDGSFKGSYMVSPTGIKARFKARVRFSLTGLVKYGLVERSAPGRYLATDLGMKIGNEYEVFSNGLLNRLLEDNRNSDDYARAEE